MNIYEKIDANEQLPHTSEDGYQVLFKAEGDEHGAGEMIIIHKPTHQAWLDEHATKIETRYGTSYGWRADAQPAGMTETRTTFAKALKTANEHGVSLGCA